MTKKPEWRRRAEGELTAEWCEEQAFTFATYAERLGHYGGGKLQRNLAAALRIASRVLADDAERSLTAIITRQMVGDALSVSTKTDAVAARAILTYLRGEA